ncbi:MAG: hypothetical protein M1837_001361 [Sclerophora amabilis]|nr:MAG: hypothetical protein M1837_001361 [Sclerophora amabilis]
MADLSGGQKEEARLAEALFCNVKFAIVRSKDLTEDDARQLIVAIERDGGEYCPPSSTSGKIVVEGISHIISTTSDFPEYLPATEGLVSVVRPAWVVASRSKRKLAATRPYNPDPRLFFGGVTICCADLPSGDKEAIIGGVIAMGGQYSGTLSKLVTHIVALSDDNEKCQVAMTKNLKCKIVLPHWFDDCLKLGKKIDERPYTIPNPEITRKAPREPVDMPNDTHLVGASSPQPAHLPSPRRSPGPLRPACDIFQKKTVMLSKDLDLGYRLRNIIEDLVSQGGGIVTSNVHNADMLICRYREGRDYQTASRAGKDVGNLSWLYYLITHNAWTSPLRRLLHYPVAHGPLPGFESYRISLSNYGGEARLYLENLVWAAGGQFTKTMKQDNTHLITARAHSEKCEAAQEWNINMVNHLWLEESYAKWRVQSLANPRYVHFPARTNLGEVVGQTQIDRQALESMFFPKLEETGSEDERTHDSAEEQLRNDTISAIPHSSEGRQDESTPKATNARKRQQNGRSPRTPAVTKIVVDGKENETPSTTGSRGAKDRAVAKLHNLAPDIALYEKERKRVGGVVRGGRQTSDEISSARKRSASVDEDSEMETSERREAKRMKRGRAPPTMRLVMTSYDRWIGDIKKEDEDRRLLRDLGILIVQDPGNCTHLAAPAIVRTQKFVAALASSPVVLSTSFIDYCLDQEELPPKNEKFLLKDPSSEKRHGFVLAAALKKAKANKRRLFRGISVYCTPNVHGGFETYKAIVAANGGTCQLFRARPGSVSSRAALTAAAVRDVNDDDGEDADELTTDEEDENALEEAVYLLSGDSQEDRKFWVKFRQMARENARKPLIVRTEWLLDSAMAQEVKEGRKYLWEIDGDV